MCPVHLLLSCLSNSFVLFILGIHYLWICQKFLIERELEQLKSHSGEKNMALDYPSFLEVGISRKGLAFHYYCQEIHKDSQSIADGWMLWLRRALSAFETQVEIWLFMWLWSEADPYEGWMPFSLIQLTLIRVFSIEIVIVTRHEAEPHCLLLLHVPASYHSWMLLWCKLGLASMWPHFLFPNL